MMATKQGIVVNLKWAAVACAMVVIGFSALAKLADLAYFAEVLRTWRSLPEWMLSTTVLLVPAAELMISALWLSGFARRWMSWAALVLTIIVTAAYGFEASFGPSPKCGCAGRWAEEVPLFDTPEGVLVRNGVLIGILAVGVKGRPRSPSVPPRWPQDRVPLARLCEPSFTLIETLLVIALVSVLVAMFVPSLASMREGGAEARSLSNLRQHSATFTQYTTDFRDLYPFLTDPVATSSVVRCESRGISRELRYLDVYSSWHVALADSYYGGDPGAACFDFRDSRHGRSYSQTAYLYLFSFLARPEYWDLRTRRAAPEQFGPTAERDVVFPSAKALMFEWLPDRLVGPSIPPPRQPAAFLDGHSQVVRAIDMAPRGPVEGDCWPRWSSLPPLFAWPLHYTESGLRGRDIR